MCFPPDGYSSSMNYGKSSTECEGKIGLPSLEVLKKEKT